MGKYNEDVGCFLSRFSYYSFKVLKDPVLMAIYRSLTRMVMNKMEEMMEEGCIQTATA